MKSQMVVRRLLIKLVVLVHIFTTMNYGHAFLLPSSTTSTSTTVTATATATASKIQMKMILPNSIDTFHLNSLIVASDPTTAITDITTTNDIIMTNPALETLRTFFIILTSIIFGLFGLTYITAAFIIPKAAEQLENDTKRLRPGLWEEYEGKLKEGETMSSRPDLLQELGNIMQPIIIKDFEDSAAVKSGNNNNNNSSSMSSDKSSTSPTTMSDSDQWKD